MCTTASRYGDVINPLLLLLLMLTVGCHGDRYEQPASRMMVLRDLPDGVDPNRPQHLIIRTAYKVLSLFELLLLPCFDDMLVLPALVLVASKIHRPFCER